jgi:hypothetical protein
MGVLDAQPTVTTVTAISATAPSVLTSPSCFIPNYLSADLLSECDDTGRLFPCTMVRRRKRRFGSHWVIPKYQGEKMYWHDVAYELQPYLDRGELDFCVTYVSGIIRALPTTPYHAVLNSDFSNDPAEVASYFDQFVLDNYGLHNFEAIYTETNGFYINLDRWYFDIFGYHTYGGVNQNVYSQYDWLAYWDAHFPHEVILTGLERLQQIYKEVDDSGIYETVGVGITPEVNRMEDAHNYSDLLVVLYFQRLIQRSAAFMQSVNVPVLATTHDYDFIFEVYPNK